MARPICGCGRTSSPLPAPGAPGPSRRGTRTGRPCGARTEGSARRTWKPSPRSRVAGVTTASMARRSADTVRYSARRPAGASTPFSCHPWSALFLQSLPAVPEWSAEMARRHRTGKKNMLERLKRFLQGILNALGKAGSEAASEPGTARVAASTGSLRSEASSRSPWCWARRATCSTATPPSKTVEPRRGRRSHQPPHRRASASGTRAASSSCPACSGCACSRCATRAGGAAQIEPRRRAGAAAVGRGTLARRRPDGALRDRSAQGRGARQEPARRRRRRDRRAGGAGRDLQGVRALHGARDLLDQAQRDPGRRSRTSSKPQARRRRRRPAPRADRQGRPAAPTTGAAWRACSPKSSPAEKMKYTLDLKEKQVKETELDGEVGEGAPRDRRRGRGARAGDRRQGRRKRR